MGQGWHKLKDSIPDLATGYLTWLRYRWHCHIITPFLLRIKDGRKEFHPGSCSREVPLQNPGRRKDSHHGHGCHGRWDRTARQTG